MICFGFKLGVCVCVCECVCVCARIFFLLQPNPVFALSESLPNCETMRNTLPGRLGFPTLRLTASRSNQLSYGSRCSFGCTLSSMCLICSVLLSSVLCCFVLCCCVGSLAVRCWLCFVLFFCVLCFPCGSRLSIAVSIHSVVVLFCSDLFWSCLFCVVLLWSVLVCLMVFFVVLSCLFCSVLLCSVLSCAALFVFVLFRCVLCCYVLCCAVLRCAAGSALVCPIMF